MSEAYEDSEASRSILEHLSSLLHEGNLGHEETDGGLITSFVCIVEYIDDAGEHGWDFIVAPDTRLSGAIGITEFMLAGLKADAADHWRE